MKKFLTILMIGFYFSLITGCEEEINNNNNNNNNNNQNGAVETPDENPNEYDAYLDELNEIINVEKHKIFERYGDFTDKLENYLYMGKYPGREVTNSALIAELEKITDTNEYGYMEFEGYEFVKVVIENTYDSLEIGNQEYENSTNYKIGTTHYFLVEPILWRVLSYDSNTKEAFLITNNIIDAKMYVDETGERFIDGRIIYPNNYEYSDIRNWCNNVFYNQAFSDLEREKINLTLNSNIYIEGFHAPYHRDTEDYVFLPSFEDITEKLYGFETTGVFSYSRFSHPSDYASAKGVYTSNLEGTIPSSGLYLLRTGPDSEAYQKSYIFYVKFDGYCFNPYYVNSPSTGVRLCIKATIEN